MTNGYNDTAVDAMESRLGWVQPTAKGYDIVDEENLISESGRYFNDDSFHTALSIQNIYDCQADEDISDEDFNDYLRRLRRSNAISALNTVFDEPQYIESGLVFRKMESTQRNPIANAGNFVGIRIKVSEGNYGVNLKNAVLLMDGVKAFNLYLFHSLTNGTDTISDVVTDVTYIKKWAVTTKANSQTIVPLNYTLNYSNETVKGGVWFLGYFQTDLGTVKALDYNPFPNCYHIVGAVSFESKATGVDFDRETYGKSAGMYGLNLEFSSFVDISEDISTNAQLFDNLQGLMMVAKVIELVQTALRSNRTERITGEYVGTLLMNLEGIKTDTGQWIPGINSKIGKELAKIRKAFKGKCRDITYTNPLLSNDL